MKLNVLMKTAISCSIEVIDEKSGPYYHPLGYDVYVNGELSDSGIKTNVFTVYNLRPGAINQVKVVLQTSVYDVLIETDQVSEIIEIDYCLLQDHTGIIQEAIDHLLPHGLIIINEGVFYVRPLFLKSDITILLKGTLLGSTNREDYPILDEYLDGLPLGTWEGNVAKMFAALITGIRVRNVSIVGPGTIDGNAKKADWWVNHKVIRGAARPRTIYLNYCEKIGIAGVTIRNSPAWTIHPYYSDNLKFINLKVENPKISPNTDGCNPESCDQVEIIGCHFSVGDDCIAIKSGKIEMVEQYGRPTSNITIRNCLMENGHGAIVLGSETSGGVKDLDVSNCLFRNTDRGLRIKTRRGRGHRARIDGILFRNIRMDHVQNPFVINMFYNSDAEGKSEYVQSKDMGIVDERTPYLGSFTFRDIICENAIISAGFFYGLPEAKIGLIEYENVLVTMASSNDFGLPAMMNDFEPVNALGCYFENVREIKLKNFSVMGQKGPDMIFKNVDQIIR